MVSREDANIYDLVDDRTKYKTVRTKHIAQGPFFLRVEAGIIGFFER